MKIFTLILGLFFLNGLYALEKNTIKIAFYEDYFPYSYIENGKIVGLLDEIGRYILEDKMHYKFISAGFPWERAQEFVKSGKSDAHITVNTTQREMILTFNPTPVFKAPLVIVYSENNPRKKEIENIKSKNDLKKFIINDYIGNGTTKRDYPLSEGYNVEYSSSMESAFKKLEVNRGDVMITYVRIMKQQVSENNLKSLKLKATSILGKPDTYHFGLRKNYPNCKNIVDEFEANLVKAKKTGEINKFFLKYNVDQ